MATTYDEMIQRIINWSNRDPDVFGTSKNLSSDKWTRDNSGELSEFLEYAADKCYRALRVPPLEYTRQFIIGEDDFVSADREVDTGGITTINMGVPVDLIDVIYFRCGNTIINEKLDPRTFYDKYSIKKSDFFWTRVGNVFQVSGPLATGDTIEIHYYRRLPAMDAKYNVTAATVNFLLPDGVHQAYNYETSSVAGSEQLFFPTGTTAAANSNTGEITFDWPTIANLSEDLTWRIAADESGTVITYTGDDGNSVPVTYDAALNFTGREIEHWLRDENERIVLFGALMEAFNYLDEPEQLQKFQTMFLQEISELNVEENLRQTQGGNISVNFNSHLI